MQNTAPMLRVWLSYPLGVVELILNPSVDAAQLSRRRVTAVVAVCGTLYGAVMGSYALCSGERSIAAQLPQMFYSATKVPLLLGVTVAVSLPSFFVLNSLFGLRDDFRKVTQAVVSAQAGMTLVLLSLAPFTAFLYLAMPAGRDAYNTAVLFNAFTFGVASLSAQYLLRRYYQPLIRSNVRHRWMFWSWITVYAFVGIQCAYILRPFIGDPSLEASWFRADSFRNAYVRIYQMVLELIR